jgi:hypothetical protein
MKRAIRSNRSAGRALLAVLGMAALALGACDASVNISPTEPRLPSYTALGDRNLEITGSLRAGQGACLEATVLYDGRELPGARAVCPDPAGCARLELAARTPTSSGRHTISFRVLDQSAEAVEYLARGGVLVTREGLSLGGVRIGLGPRSAALRSGESVDFDVHFGD